MDRYNTGRSGQVDFDYPGMNIGSLLGHIARNYELCVLNNSVNYEYELQYTGETFFREAIRRLILASNSIDRTHAMFCSRYDMFDAKTKLELMDNKSLTLVETKLGKFLQTGGCELFEYDQRANTAKVNPNITESLQLEFNKITIKE